MDAVSLHRAFDRTKGLHCSPLPVFLFHFLSMTQCLFDYFRLLTNRFNGTGGSGEPEKERAKACIINCVLPVIIRQVA